jgi:hypothetical protein
MAYVFTSATIRVCDKVKGGNSVVIQKSWVLIGYNDEKISKSHFTSGYYSAENALATRGQKLEDLTIDL